MPYIYSYITRLTFNLSLLPTCIGCFVILQTR